MKKIIASLTVATSILISSSLPAYAYDFSLPIYKKGTRHEDIIQIQKALKEEGVLNIRNVTDYYGNLTESAVKSFQQRYGLLVDGIAGKQTINKMESLGLIDDSNTSYQASNQIVFSKSIYEKGDRHEEVAYIQKALKKAGTFNFYKITNYYGTITEKAVKDFQRKYGLLVDGIVGPNTIKKMRSLGLFNDVQTYTSRRGYRRYGEYLDWWTQVKGSLVNWYDILTIRDLDTGITFKVKVTGGSHHADVEPLTVKDAQALKKAWGGTYSWIRRAVVVYTKGRAIAASMNGMPHAGVDNKPSRVWVNWRSGGYGAGTNYDTVKGNGFDGHVCLHFKNSRTHSSNRIDEGHQTQVKRAAGLIK
ncbi:peptidoglycan-binding domain-containing protein [Caldisalinibacter kiritimatiensis]|uniref:N-acetylmuramoyl-L-alanine amidase n=1 Tax=Caldisalinibacter kiritimatiensis TaxID=1304284 RepID=R1CPZ1_9FIRM|nr:peptidoglycan-binding protein [Caldisalinibacter kiritimatiensis]EOD00751.1 N-acetylmuramoyl-L-alanine amidase [Caldisalinibacter kiritimatiensis]